MIQTPTQGVRAIVIFMIYFSRSKEHRQNTFLVLEPFNLILLFLDDPLFVYNRYYDSKNIFV